MQAPQSTLGSAMRGIVATLLFAVNVPVHARDVSFQNFDGFLSVGTEARRTASVSLADVDGDGDLDVLVANGRYWAEQNWVYLNDGRGGFKSAVPMGRQMDASYAVVAADLDGDGQLEIVAANDKVPNRLYRRSANGLYEEGAPLGDPASASRSIEAADIDGDGDLDLVMGNRGP